MSSFICVSGSEETKSTWFQDEAKQKEKKRSQENIDLEDRKGELKRNKDSANTSPHLQMIPSIQVMTSHS